MAELEPLLSVVDCHKGECLIRQGALEMEQYFLLDGILKRVVANQQGREMILRFADAGAMETSYAAWRLNTPVPYSIMTVTKARVAKLPLPQWVAFLDRHTDLKADIRIRSHALDERDHGAHDHAASARCAGSRAPLHAQASELSDRVPQKELASYLNLSAETLSRLRYQGKN